MGARAFALTAAEMVCSPTLVRPSPHSFNLATKAGLTRNAQRAAPANPAPRGSRAARARAPARRRRAWTTATSRPTATAAAPATVPASVLTTRTLVRRYAPRISCKTSELSAPRSAELGVCRACDPGVLACTGNGEGGATQWCVAWTACLSGSRARFLNVCLLGAAAPPTTERSSSWATARVCRVMRAPSGLSPMRVRASPAPAPFPSLTLFHLAPADDKTCSSCAARFGEDAGSCTADEITACTDGVRYNGGCIESCPVNVGVLVGASVSRLPLRLCELLLRTRHVPAGDECILCSDRFAGSSTCTAAGPTSWCDLFSLLAALFLKRHP